MWLSFSFANSVNSQFAICKSVFNFTIYEKAQRDATSGYRMVNGIPTAHSHPFMKQYFESDAMYVWPDHSAPYRGLSIEPLYPNQNKGGKARRKLYKLLALIDVIRVGRTRETKIAQEELTKAILHESTQ